MHGRVDLAPAPAALARRRALPLAPLLFGLALVCAALLALPGRTVTTIYVNDLLIFLDGAHRILWGQVPNRDFHTALGPLVYLLPAAALALTGSPGAAMPIAMAAWILLLAPAIVHVATTRLRPPLALAAGALLILMVAVPMNLGESVTALSFAMFYNRVGWAALGALLLMYLTPAAPAPRQGTRDVACATFLTLAMLYTKVSYGAVAVGFLVFLLLDRAHRDVAATALVLVAAAGLLVELAWGGTAAHVADLALASRVSGTTPTAREFVDIALRDLPGLVLFALAGALALWRSRSLRDLLFFGFCAVAGFLLIRQNFQLVGIMTLPVAAAVAAELIARSAPDPRPVRGPDLVVLAMVLPLAAQWVLGLGLHAGLAAARAGEPFRMERFRAIHLVPLWSGPAFPSMAFYARTLDAGAEALAGLEPPAERVFVLDFVSPFSAGLGLRPPRGDSAWQHWGRTVDWGLFVPPERLLADVDVIMEPKAPVEEWTANGLRRIYAPYLEANFRIVRETPLWWVWRRAR